MSDLCLDTSVTVMSVVCVLPWLAAGVFQAELAVRHTGQRQFVSQPVNQSGSQSFFLKDPKTDSEYQFGLLKSNY
jgi:hypothetical protein